MAEYAEGGTVRDNLDSPTFKVNGCDYIIPYTVAKGYGKAFLARLAEGREQAGGDD